MVWVLQQALGYDKHQVNAVIASLIHIDRLPYHPAGEQPSDLGEGHRPISANLQEIVYLIKSMSHHAAASSEGARSLRSNSHRRAAAACCRRFRGLLTR